MEYEQVYRCSDAVDPKPSNTVKLDDSYTLVSRDYDRSSCVKEQSNPNCELAENKCTSTTPPTLPPGINVTSVAPDGCFQRQENYACADMNQFYSDCSQFAKDPNCTLVETRVPSDVTKVNGKGYITEKRYKCQSKPASTTTVADCGGQVFCVDGNCFDSSHPADADMVKTATMMEAAREAGKYFDPNSMRLFNGVGEKCTRKLLKNCCNEGTVTKSNNNVWQSAGLQVGSWLGKGAYEAGSSYAYDFMFDSGIFKDFAFDGMASLAESSAGAANFSQVGSFYGLSVWSGAASTVPAVGGSFTGATVSSLGSIGEFQFGFDPYSLAISLAIQVIMSMMSCDESDVYTATHNNMGLCHYVGDYCSQQYPITGCIERKNSYCCYNSKLAKIVNVQGRPLIGKSWGDVNSPDCSGFTTAEFQKIDFNALDLSEFYSEIVPRDIGSFGTQINTQMGTRINEKIDGAAP
jgi:conjugal transfer mating pair stabilization protein TraN